MKKVIHTSIELIADEGMILTDGEHYCSAVLLPYEQGDSNWSEISINDVPLEKREEI